MRIVKTLSAPTSVQLEITNLCNHKCIHCYNPCRGSKDLSKIKNTLSYQELDVIIEELHKNNIWHLTITGGEPLIMPEIVFYIKKKCDEFGIDVSLNTNLTLMTDELARKFKKDLNWNTLILTSLPGLDSETCDKITQKQGSFNQIISGINRCIENNIPVGVNIVLSNDNLSEFLDKIEDFVKKQKINYLALTRAIEPSYAKDKKYEFTKRDIVMIANKLIELKGKYNIEVDSLIPFPLCVLKNQSKYHDILNTKCCAGILECTITANGDIKACSHENKTYGNIFDEGLKRCWFNMDEWRNGSNLNLECINCKNLIACGGDCRQTSYTDYLNNLEEVILIENKEGSIDDNELFNRKLKYNKNVKIRCEEFGYILHIDGKDYLVDKSFSEIHDFFSNINEFAISDIKEYFEDENDLLYLIKNLKDMQYLNFID